MQKNRIFYLITTAVWAAAQCGVWLCFPVRTPADGWVNSAVCLALAALYALCGLLYFRRESERASLQMQQEVDRVLRDSEAEISSQDSALLRLTAHIRDSERSARIINSYTFHELRNGIAMLTSKLQAGYPPDKLMESFADVNRSVEDLLALSALKNESWEKIDLAMVCAMVVDDYRKKHTDVHFLFEDSVSPVRGRTSLAYSAVSNLVDNAIKYGEGRINVGISQCGDSVILYVENTGDGLSREQIDGMFDFQKRMNNLKKDGYGIGLSLVKNVAEVFGGFVWVSCRNHITRFYMSTPIC